MTVGGLLSCPQHNDLLFSSTTFSALQRMHDTFFSLVVSNLTPGGLHLDALSTVG